MFGGAVGFGAQFAVFDLAGEVDVALWVVEVFVLLDDGDDGEGGGVFALRGEDFDAFLGADLELLGADAEPEDVVIGRAGEELEGGSRSIGMLTSCDIF